MQPPMNRALYSLCLMLLLPLQAIAHNPDSIYVRPQLYAEYPEGPQLMQWFIRWQLVYPPAAALRKAEGKVWVQFVVDTFGNIGNARVIRGIAPDMDTAALNVIRAMPRWLPAYHDSVPVKSLVTLGIEFSLKNNKDIFYEEEGDARFPGGSALIFGYLALHTTYPEAYKDKHIKCMPLIRFIVDKDGELSNFAVFRKSSDPLLDTVALMAVAAMPQWHPAYENGKPVASFVVLPVPLNTDVLSQAFGRDPFLREKCEAYRRLHPPLGTSTRYLRYGRSMWILHY